MDIAKYVAIGVLAVIVLATVTYEPPENEPVTVAALTDPDGAGDEFADEEPVLPDLPAVQGGFEAGVGADPGDSSGLELPPLPPLDGLAAPPQTGTQAQPEPVVAPEPQAQPAQPQERTYVVKAGQTLSDVAREVLGDARRWRDVYQANKQRIPNPDRIQAGLKLLVPESQAKSLPASAKREPAVPAGEGARYQVKKGDTLYSIARRELNAPGRWREIARLNGIDANSIKVGAWLRLPPK